MSEHLQPGLHPDPDSLNAFVEGVLPEHERLACLAHLADCSQCREVVYLSQELPSAEPLPVPAAEKTSFWKRWFRPIPALSAASVGVAVFSVVLYRIDKPVPETAKRVVSAPSAMLSAPAPPKGTEQLRITRAVPKAVPETALSTTPRSAKTKAIQEPEARSTTAVAAQANSLPATATPALPFAQSPPSPAREVPLASPQLSAFDRATTSNPAVGAQTGITGIVADASGGVIAGADVRVRRLANPGSRDLKADGRGQFDVAGLEPGRYELQASAPGFQQVRQQVEVQPTQVARADLTLKVGSVSETVMVESAAPTLSTETASITGKKAVVRPLPIQPAARTTVSVGKRMLGTDPDGKLLQSDNAGKSWKAVKPVWQGKIGSLVAISPSPSGDVFQLTTDTGVMWLSRDGSRWHAAPAQKK